MALFFKAANRRQMVGSDRRSAGDDVGDDVMDGEESREEMIMERKPFGPL